MRSTQNLGMVFSAVIFDSPAYLDTEEMMSQQMLDELRLMVEDNAQARSPFKATDLVWTTIANDFRSRIERRGAGDLLDFNSRFASYPSTDRRYERFARLMGVTQSFDWHASACQAYHDLLKARDPHGVLTKTRGVVSWDWLLSVEAVTSILEFMPDLLTEPKVIVDLGSGWGRLGVVLTKLNPKVTYIACDIPESLIVAQTHLPQHVSVPVHPYSEARGTTEFSEGVWFCGSQHLDRMQDKSVDLFINTFSFQEMTLQQVTEYFDVIDRVTKGLLYMQQRNAGDQMTHDNYPYLSHWQMLSDRRTVVFPNFFEAIYRVGQ